MEEEGKDDWSLEDNLSQAPSFAQEENGEDGSSFSDSHRQKEEKKADQGTQEIYLAAFGFILAPLLLISLFSSWKKMEKNREEGKRGGIKLYFALLLSLVGIGFYLLLIAVLLLSQAKLI
jgi:hypothetical protein